MLSACLLFGLLSPRRSLLAIHAQSPTDPLAYAPGMSVGARVQLGLNIFPSDWNYQGKLAEEVSEDRKLAGFRLLSVSPKAVKVAAGFTEIPCSFIGTTPVVTVFSQDGAKHRFTIDTGAVHSYMRSDMAASLNFGRTDALPLCLYLPEHKWIHFKAEVDRNLAVLASPSADFPVDGILGMNALACLQLKIDYRQRKMWGRVSATAFDTSAAGAALGLTVATTLVAIPMMKQDSGRYAVSASFGETTLPMEVDTGANVLGLGPKSIAKLTLNRVGGGEVLVENGTKLLSRYLAGDSNIGDVKFLWPVVHEGLDDSTEIGGFGPSILPHQVVIIDYPDRKLFTLKPTESELVEQALGQLISGVARIQGDSVLLDMPDIVGTSKALLMKIQNRTTASVLSDLRLWSKGVADARVRLLALYRQLGSPGGSITIIQDGMTKIIPIGPTG